MTPQGPIDLPLQPDEVDFVSGRTRLFGIVGDPIEQVRSPEMFTAEFRKRGYEAILVPLHVKPPHFETCLAGLLTLANLDGLIFTIPYKVKAFALADSIGEQASIVGAVNALSRNGDGWKADIFDGIGCVEAFRRRGYPLHGKRVMLIGAGGAGSAVGVAIAFERPASLRLFDPDTRRAEDLAEKIRKIDPSISVEIGAPSVDGRDVLLNASPVGMLHDSRLPLEAERLPENLIVLDAVVKPERTPLLALAERSGCRTLYGREMMRGQIDRMVDYFGCPRKQRLVD
jgi:shikimate dehydrogenase